MKERKIISQVEGWEGPGLRVDLVSALCQEAAGRRSQLHPRAQWVRLQLQWGGQAERPLTEKQRNRAAIWAPAPRSECCACGEQPAPAPAPAPAPRAPGSLSCRWGSINSRHLQPHTCTWSSSRASGRGIGQTECVETLPTLKEYSTAAVEKNVLGKDLLQEN